MNPLLSSLLAECWAMDPRRLEAMIAEVASVAAGGIRPGPQAFFGFGAPATPVLSVESGVATIPIHGVIMRSVHPILRAFGFAGADLGEIRGLLLEAFVREDVKSIVLDIDSPGGTVSGTKELADEVSSTRGSKPISARASGTLASAAYWIASQADSISATVGTVIGSIGVVGVVHDSSRAAEGAGVKVHVISSSPLKGAGIAPGAPISAEQLADMKRNIDTFAGMFAADVARGRAMSAEQLEAVATGQVWVGPEAKALGLIDEIEKPGSKQQEQKMDAERMKAELAEQAAEIARLKAIAAAAEANSKALEEQAKFALLTTYADRFMPAARGAFEALAASMTREQLDAHLKSLPKVTREYPVSAAPTTPAPTRPDAQSSLGSYVSRAGVGGESGAKQVARWLGTSVERLDKYARVIGWRSNGTYELDDGRVVTKAELDAAIAS